MKRIIAIAIAGILLCGAAEAQVYGTPSVQVAVGTWTPTPAGDATAGSTTCSLAVGNYFQTKGAGGNFVIADFKVICTGAGTMTGNLIITGIPIPAINVTDYDGDCTFSRFGGLTPATGKTMVNGTILSNTSTIYIDNVGAVGPAVSAVSQQAITGVAAGSWSIFGQCRYRSQ